MKKSLSKITLFTLSTTLLIPATSNATYRETSPTSTSKLTEEILQPYEVHKKAFMKVYDKENNLIKSYSKEEIKQFNQQVLVPNYLALPQTSNKESFVHSYDENGIMISSNDKNLLSSQRKALEKLRAANLSVYNFSTTSFSNNIWIADGRTFYKPQSVYVELRKEVYEMAVLIYKDNSYYGQVKVGYLMGRLNIITDYLTQLEGNYQIQLQNQSQHNIHLDGGQVYYE